MRIKAVLLFGLAMLILTACGGRKEDQKMAPAPEFVFTYAENQAEDYPTTQGACRFADLVEEKTGGRIKILVKADGNLGDEKTVIEQIQFGGVDFACVPDATGGICPQAECSADAVSLYGKRTHVEGSGWRDRGRFLKFL